jgi:hypothetical protein
MVFVKNAKYGNYTLILQIKQQSTVPNKPSQQKGCPCEAAFFKKEGSIYSIISLWISLWVLLCRLIK